MLLVSAAYLRLGSVRSQSPVDKSNHAVKFYGCNGNLRISLRCLSAQMGQFLSITPEIFLSHWTKCGANATSNELLNVVYVWKPVFRHTIHYSSNNVHLGTNLRMILEISSSKSTKNISHRINNLETLLWCLSFHDELSKNTD